MFLDILADLVVELDQAVHGDSNADRLEDNDLDETPLVLQHITRNQVAVIPKYVQKPDSATLHNTCQRLAW